MQTDTDLERRKSEREVSAGGGALIARGADLVYLAELFYVRLLMLAAGLTVAGGLVSIWFAAISSRRVTILTLVFAAAGIAFGLVALSRPRIVYLWLRYSRPHQLSPLILSIPAVLLNGPDSPSWWVALPLLWVIAFVSSTPVALTAALITAGAYIAGTLAGGEALVHHGDAGILAAAIALAANTLVGRFVAELFVRFILFLHQLEHDIAPRPQRPAIVPNLAKRSSEALSTLRTPSRRASADRLTKLTSRELEVALLLRDGLSHTEIAVALGITTRQVERLLMRARERAGAQTPGELLAMLVNGKLAPD